METMEVVSLPGQLAACCADRQQLAYLIYYSTTVYHQSVPDGFLLAPANSKMSFQRLKMI